MPQRAPPKAYHLLLKSRKLTVFLTVHQSATIATLKEEALSALTPAVLSTAFAEPRIPTAPDEDEDMMSEEEGEAEMPRVSSTSDFELCRGIKDKGKSTTVLSTSPNVSYEALDPSMMIKGLLNNWETLYIQFKDEDGNLLPIQVSQPSLLEEEEEEPRRAPSGLEPPVSVGKGKRKAPPE